MIRLPRWLGKSRFEREMAEEMHFHMERRAAELVAAGSSPADARRQARLEFGAVDAAKEECRDASGFGLLDELALNLRYGLRGIRKSPAFALVAVAILALGIGACTAVFSVVNSVLLRPMPYPDSGRIVRIYTNNPSLQVKTGPTSYPDARDWGESGLFKAAGIYWSDQQIVTVRGETSRVLTGIATGGIFSVLGVTPIRGRLFTTAEDVPSRTPVALLTERFWKRRLGGDERAIGSSILLDGRPVLVVGVIPVILAHDTAAELWISPILENGAAERQNRYWAALGRLRDGVSLEQTQERLRQLCRRLAETYPGANKDWSVDLASFRDSVVGDTRSELLLLFGSVLFVLLIVCANVATLFLVRAIARERELDIRAAIGAGRGRLLRQLLTESALLAGIGALVGSALAFTAVHLLRVYGPVDLPRLEEVSVDLRALAFAVALAAATGLLSGIAPAIYMSRREGDLAGRKGARFATLGLKGVRLRSALVAAQVALSVVLLVGAGLLIKTMRAITQEDVGFRADHLLTAFISMPPSRYFAEDKFQEAAVSNYAEKVLTGVATLPGVTSVASGLYVPVGGGGYQPWMKLYVAGQEPQFEHGISQIVSAGYFETLEIPLKAGRLFTAADDARAAPVGIVNERFALDRFGSIGEALGKRVRREGEKSQMEIIGVVGNVKTGLPSEPAPPQIYAPERQNPVPFLAVFLRTTQDPLLLAPAFERRVLEIDKDIPAYRIRSAGQAISIALSGKRFLTALMAGFAGVAVLLSMIGLYGLLAYTVAQRTREFGVRLALGAQSSQVVWDVLVRGLQLLAAGVAVGFAGALAISHLLGAFLYRVSPYDPAVLLLVAGITLLAGFSGCWVPARRAGSIDPSAALRVE
jgi:putative ABC transport system permease protein